jgi:putative phosphoribosyl transferase
MREGPERSISEPLRRQVRIAAGPVTLEGQWCVPSRAVGLALFAHGSGSSQHSPRNQFVAKVLQESGVGTLLFDLLTRPEEALAHVRFDIQLLSRRLVFATRWITSQPRVQSLGIGYFGASTGGAAALDAAASLGSTIRAVVSRGGRPELAGDSLPRVSAPTLLLVGEKDEGVGRLNQQAYEQLRCIKQLIVLRGASHLFEEPGALQEVARLAAVWFGRYLQGH